MAPVGFISIATLLELRIWKLEISNLFKKSLIVIDEETKAVKATFMKEF
jgi:hypothetical protein